MIPEYLTTAEVAALYKVGQPAVRRWARDGLITAVRTPTGRWLFPAAQFAALIQHLNSREILGSLPGARPADAVPEGPAVPPAGRGAAAVTPVTAAAPPTSTRGEHPYPPADPQLLERVIARLVHMDDGTEAAS